MACLGRDQRVHVMRRNNVGPPIVHNGFECGQRWAISLLPLNLQLSFRMPLVYQIPNLIVAAILERALFSVLLECDVQLRQRDEHCTQIVPNVRPQSRRSVCTVFGHRCPDNTVHNLEAPERMAVLRDEGFCVTYFYSTAKNVKYEVRERQSGQRRIGEQIEVDLHSPWEGRISAERERAHRSCRLKHKMGEAGPE